MKSPVSDKTGRLLLSQTAGHRPSDSFWCHRSRIVYNRMARSNGTRLGPYEILSALGAGGMGEVYRATDTNLKRQVAIKVLLTSVAIDADRLARFQREAEVLAALNHPNIAHIHGLEKKDGILALVMELVEGPTLADLIAKGDRKSTRLTS